MKRYELRLLFGAKKGKRVRNRGGNLAFILAIKRQVFRGHHRHQPAFGEEEIAVRQC